ncbi:MAG TPA: adenylate kinase [Planctomycetota bacterium]|nr:adenylate kinase [Planctomycetota bacterium]
MAVSLKARCVFLGAPGAGKGTQAKKAAEAASLAHISTGDMLRHEVTAGTALGRQAKGYMDAGKLVPDEVIIGMVRARIRQPDARSAWILDGFPRTLPQAEALDKSLSGAEALSHVIFFAVPEPVLVERLSGRRTCSKCGAIWHVEHQPTKHPGVCDKCGGELTQRSDDRPEAIAKRLEVYRLQTAPLLAYYRDRNVLREIDANRPPAIVFQELLKLMQ